VSLPFSGGSCRRGLGRLGRLTALAGSGRVGEVRDRHVDHAPADQWPDRGLDTGCELRYRHSPGCAYLYLDRAVADPYSQDTTAWKIRRYLAWESPVQIFDPSAAANSLRNHVHIDAVDELARRRRGGCGHHETRPGLC
jgi:hypothetical protein